MSIVSYAHLCQEQQRTLVLDLREFKYLIDPQVNFTRHFAFEGKDWPAVEMDPDFIDKLYARDNRLDYVYEEDLIESMVHRIQPDHSDPDLVVIPSRYFCWNPAWGKKSIRLGLRGSLKHLFGKVRFRYFSDKPVIGIHHRHGNTEHLDGRIGPNSPGHSNNCSQLLDAYTRKVQQVRDSYPGDFAILVCSDNRRFREDLQRRLPSAFSVTKHLPETPHLRMDAENSPAECRDAILDLWCLNECSFLIGAGSAFLDFAAFNSRILQKKNRLTVRVNHLLDRVPGSPEASLIKDTLLLRLFLRNAPVTFNTYQRILELAGETSRAATAGSRAENMKYHEREDWKESVSLLASAELPAAISLIRDAASSAHNPFMWSHLSDLLLIAGRYEDSEHAIRKAVELDPGWPWFQSTLAKVLNLMNMREPSLRAAELAVHCAPYSALLQARLCCLRSRLGTQVDKDSQAVSDLVRSGRLGMSFTNEPGFFIR